MATITEIIGFDNMGSFALVHVKVGEDEAVVYVGGSVELYHDDKFDKTKAFVKKSR